jgi:hypothetical protein
MATKRTFEENLALLKARGKPAAAKKRSVVPAKQMSLELWPDAVRGVPNVALRNALFGVSKVRKTYKNRTLIKSLDGVELRFKGETFNQTDFDVWAMLLHLGRLQPLGMKVEFTAGAFLKALGRGTSGKNHEDLKEEFARLMGGVVEVSWTKEKRSFASQLVSKIFRDDDTERYVAILDKDILKLFADGWTMLDCESRQALGKNHLAKWLQNHYSSHAKPYPMRVETLRELCGSGTKDLSKFRTMLRAALDELVRVGTLSSWDIKNDLVSVAVVPSKSQIKHLSKPKSNPRSGTY